MPWFLVDDHFHSHPHAAKAIATEPAALGLWVVAGSWSSAHLTDGVVPDDVLPQLLPDAVKLAEALVTARLWKRVKGGYRFVPGVTHKIPQKQAVENERKAAAERKRRQRGRHADVTPMSRSPEPGENEDDQHSPRSDGSMSRRDSRRDTAVTLVHPGSIPDSSVVDVVDLTNGSNHARASPETIEAIIKEILDITGRHITEDWAQRIAAQLLGGRSTASPAAYARQAIRNEPDPKKRFLPLY